MNISCSFFQYSVSDSNQFLLLIVLVEDSKSSLMNQCSFILKGGRESDTCSLPFDIVVKTNCSVLLFVFPAPLLTMNVNRKEPQPLSRMLLASLPNYWCDLIQSHGLNTMCGVMSPRSITLP